MSHWMCSDCQYIYEAEMPEDACPRCHGECDFYNITCYIPECGGPGNIDTRLVEQVKMVLRKERHVLSSS